MRVLLSIAAVMAGLLVPGSSSQAQALAPQSSQPDSTGPQDPRSTGSTCRSGETLSKCLESTDGVIRPPSNITPNNVITPPDPGTTRVIPPPGSPGGNPTLEPK
jgi:hypothetical protein